MKATNEKEKGGSMVSKSLQLIIDLLKRNKVVCVSPDLRNEAFNEILNQHKIDIANGKKVFCPRLYYLSDYRNESK